MEKKKEEYLFDEIRPHRITSRPSSALALAASNFVKEGSTLLTQLAERVGLGQPDALKLPGCLGLTLSNDAVMETERRREAAGDGVVPDSFVSKTLYDVGCALLDNLFDGRPIQRFWFLEVIARIPYFSYVSMLHLYESLGWWRACELRKLHYAEEWNELHHLLIMESLGGDEQWSDRFLGYHVAIAYYWTLNAVFLVSPSAAYSFMELLEAHAVDTYSTFVEENRDRLAELPAPRVAVKYYTTGDLYLFDEFQVSRPRGSRRPPCDSLLDVFTNIAEDEAEHVKTMKACGNYARTGIDVFKDPDDDSDLRDTDENIRAKRDEWTQWADSVNSAPTAQTSENTTTIQEQVR